MDYPLELLSRKTANSCFQLNPIKPSVHKMIKHTLKMLQDVFRVLDHFVDTKR